jgi:pyruvate,water dikinase
MTDVESVGGKNASLGEMISQLSSTGVRVPTGFATTSLALFFRVLLVSPKRLARMWGRWRGLRAWATQHGH